MEPPARMEPVFLVNSPLLRVVFAAYLAVLTPATCCCAIKGLLSRVTGSAVISCGSVCGGRALSGVVYVSAVKSGSGSCCAGAASNEADRPEDESSKHCRCHEQSIDMQRPDSAGPKPLVALPQLEPAAAIIDFALDDHDADRIVQRITSCSRFERPPPSTLLAQHCLLII